MQLTGAAEKTAALERLDHAGSRGFLSYPVLSEYAPFFGNIRGERRFKQLMERVKHEWQRFEVL